MTLTPEDKDFCRLYRERIINRFDIDRQEGMLHSKDGKHSESSESEADDVIEFIFSKYASVTPDEIVQKVVNILCKWTNCKQRGSCQEKQEGFMICSHIDKAKHILSQILPYFEAQKEKAWELQDTLLELTVLNQTAPKIVLTNDECGWNISYLPNAPSNEGEITMMRGNPLEVVIALKQALKEVSDE